VALTAWCPSDHSAMQAGPQDRRRAQRADQDGSSGASHGPADEAAGHARGTGERERCL